MCRTAALLLPIVLSLVHSPVSAQELTLKVEYIIFDCMRRPDLFDSFADPKRQTGNERDELAMRLRKEVPVTDSVKCITLIVVGDLVMHASTAGAREIRVLAKAEPPTEGGSYPMELGMSCNLLTQGGFHRGLSKWSRRRQLRLNELQMLANSASLTRNQAGNVTARDICIWFVTLTEGRPDGGDDRDFLEIHPRFRPPPRPIQGPKAAAQAAHFDGVALLAG